MTHYKTGTHTVEINAERYINAVHIPSRYAGAITKTAEGKRYKVNVTKLPNAGEYQTPAQTDEALNEALDAIGVEAATTRADYRLDNYDAPYTEELKLMTALVHCIAYRTRQSERVQYTMHGAPMQIHSVRCMPDKNDTGTEYGVEYYDKEYQRQSRENGRGRLELRRLNMGGGTIRGAVKDWKYLLKSIGRGTYLYALEEHARSLARAYCKGTPMEQFIDAVAPEFIGREEEPMLRKLIGSKSNKRKAAYLPRWGHVKAHIDWIIDHLERELSS